MNSNRHLQIQIILGTITEWGIVTWCAYKLLCLIGAVLEWVCANVLNSITAVCIGIMLVVLISVLAVMYTPEGGEEIEE